MKGNETLYLVLTDLFAYFLLMSSARLEAQTAQSTVCRLRYHPWHAFLNLQNSAPTLKHVTVEKIHFKIMLS